MTRLFQEHTQRTVTSLDGLWEFAFLGDVDPDEVDIATLAFDDRMLVPACFDATPPYAGKRGLVAYRTQITLKETPHHRLVFESAHHWARVFVDGSQIGEHIGGFTQFALDLPQMTSGTHELVVLVDNRIDYARTPLHLDYFDWYHYGGLSGSVHLHHLPSAWIERVTVIVDDLASRSLHLKVAYRVLTARTVPFALTVGGKTILTDEIALETGQGILNYDFQLPDAALWSSESPTLHTALVTLGDDDLIERFGIRTVAVRGRDILINGESQRLLGFNRHHSHPEFGFTLPPNIDYADLMILRDVGCNFVRGSHYPQTRAFLDLCDQLGVLVWVEGIAWQQTSEHLNDPHYMNALHTHIDEMIAMSENHPSVILWGILNESASHEPASRDGYEALIGQIRAADPTRPVTYASNHPFDDLNLELVDVVSINQYPGWYDGQLEDVPRYLDNYITHLDAHGCADKPIIISEIGAGAIYGWRDPHNTRWTEAYQTALLESVITHLFHTQKRVCGLAIWQYCDTRTSHDTRLALGRPRDFNNKGIVDEYRRPKEAYKTVKALFSELRDQ